MNYLPTYKLIFASILLFISTFSFAEDEIKSPYELISNSTKLVIAHMDIAPDQMDAREQYARQIIEKEVLPTLDFLSMTKLAVGKFWKRSSSEQQDELFYEFKTLLVRTYIKVFAKFKHLNVVVLPYKKGRRPDRALVKTEVIHENGGKTSINYKFRLVKDKKWLIYDIKVEGISIVTNYRTSFSSEIARNGINGLIKLLKDKNVSR